MQATVSAFSLGLSTAPDCRRIWLNSSVRPDWLLAPFIRIWNSYVVGLPSVSKSKPQPCASLILSFEQEVQVQAELPTDRLLRMRRYKKLASIADSTAGKLEVPTASM